MVNILFNSLSFENCSAFGNTYIVIFMSISFMRENLRWLRESFKFKILVKGIDESNFHEHPDNPHVIEIIRQKAQIPKEISCKLCGDGYYEKDKADHIKQLHTDEYGNLKFPRCDLTFPTLTKVFLHIRYFGLSSFEGGHVVRKSRNMNRAI